MTLELKVKVTHSLKLLIFTTQIAYSSFIFRLRFCIFVTIVAYRCVNYNKGLKNRDMTYGSEVKVKYS